MKVSPKERWNERVGVSQGMTARICALEGTVRHFIVQRKMGAKDEERLSALWHRVCDLEERENTSERLEIARLRRLEETVSQLFKASKISIKKEPLIKYRKRPIVVDAVRFLGIEERLGARWAQFEGYALGVCPKWMDKQFIVSSVYDELEITVLEGQVVAKPGDWIIRGVQGEIYPCKPDIFEATYEEV